MGHRSGRRVRRMQPHRLEEAGRQVAHTYGRTAEPVQLVQFIPDIECVSVDDNESEAADEVYLFLGLSRLAEVNIFRTRDVWELVGLPEGSRIALGRPGTAVAPLHLTGCAVTLQEVKVVQAAERLARGPDTFDLGRYATRSAPVVIIPRSEEGTEGQFVDGVPLRSDGQMEAGVPKISNIRMTGYAGWRYAVV